MSLPTLYTREEVNLFLGNCSYFRVFTTPKHIDPPIRYAIFHFPLEPEGATTYTALLTPEMYDELKSLEDL